MSLWRLSEEYPEHVRKAYFDWQHEIPIIHAKSVMLYPDSPPQTRDELLAVMQSIYPCGLDDISSQYFDRNWQGLLDILAEQYAGRRLMGYRVYTDA